MPFPQTLLMDEFEAVKRAVEERDEILIEDEPWVFLLHDPEALNQGLYREMGLRPAPRDLSWYLKEAGIPVPPHSADLSVGYLENVGICAEGDFHFSLYKGSQGIATLGFCLPEEEPGTILLHQIQGAGSAASPFSCRDMLPAQWERKMVRALELWALDSGAERVRIPRAEKTPYYSHPAKIHTPEDRRAHMQRMKLRYDVTARRSGYQLDPLNGTYLKKLG